MNNLDEIKNKIEKDKIEILYLNFIDVKGQIRTKGIFTYELLKNLEGFFHDGVSVTGNLRDEYAEQSDFFIIRPIAKTFTVLNWLESENYKSAFVLCEILGSSLDSRGVIEKIVATMLEKNMEPMCGLGITYKLDGDNSLANNGYYKLLPSSDLNTFNTKAANILISSGIDIEYFIPSGTNHNHLAFVTKDLLRAIDQNALSLWLTASVAAHEKRLIEFSKPFENAAPIHFSIWDKGQHNNLFYDGKNEFELSDLGYSFIAGVLKYFDELFAIVIGSAGKMPTVNYKRNYSYKDDDNVISAPCYFFENGKIARSGWSKRCIFRGMPQETNLYITVPCIFAAGMAGITEKLKVEDFCDDNYNVKTSSIMEKIEKFANCSLFTDLLGESITSILIDNLRCFSKNQKEN